jgi:hypothetical protein
MNGMTQRRRLPASAAERAQARAIAHYLTANLSAGEREPPLLATLACVSAHFPGVSLRTALTGRVFRELLLEPMGHA